MTAVAQRTCRLTPRPPWASQLFGLPPTFIAVETVDASRDESVDYAARLCRTGMPTELHRYAGTVKHAVRDRADWPAGSHNTGNNRRTGQNAVV